MKVTRLGVVGRRLWFRWVSLVVLGHAGAIGATWSWHQPAAAGQECDRICSLAPAPEMLASTLATSPAGSDAEVRCVPWHHHVSGRAPWRHIRASEANRPVARPRHSRAPQEHACSASTLRLPMPRRSAPHPSVTTDGASP